MKTVQAVIGATHHVSAVRRQKSAGARTLGSCATRLKCECTSAQLRYGRNGISEFQIRTTMPTVVVHTTSKSAIPMRRKYRERVTPACDAVKMSLNCERRLENQ